MLILLVECTFVVQSVQRFFRVYPLYIINFEDDFDGGKSHEKTPFLYVNPYILYFTAQITQHYKNILQHILLLLLIIIIKYNINKDLEVFAFHLYVLLNGKCQYRVVRYKQ